MAAGDQGEELGTMESAGADLRRPRWRWPRGVDQSGRSTAIAPGSKRANESSGHLALEDLAIATGAFVPAAPGRCSRCTGPSPRSTAPGHSPAARPARSARAPLTSRACPRATEFPFPFRLPSMTEDHQPEPGINHGVPGTCRSDKPESPVLRSTSTSNPPYLLLSPPENRKSV